MTEPITIRGNDVPQRVEGTIEATVDGDIVVLSPKDYMYFGMDGSGVNIWEWIDGQRSVDDIVIGLIEQFQGDPDVIRADTLAYIESLVAAGLVQL